MVGGVWDTQVAPKLAVLTILPPLPTQKQIPSTGQLTRVSGLLVTVVCTLFQKPPTGEFVMIAPSNPTAKQTLPTAQLTASNESEVVWLDGNENQLVPPVRVPSATFEGPTA